jgi:hypothetical protein
MKEKLFGNVYVIEPYDLTFAKNIEFQIPFKEFDGDEKKVDVLQFEPQKEIYLKLPSELDNDNHMLKFQLNIGGVYIFVEKQSTVCYIFCYILPSDLMVLKEQIFDNKWILLSISDTATPTLFDTLTVTF